MTEESATMSDSFPHLSFGSSGRASTATASYRISPPRLRKYAGNGQNGTKDCYNRPVHRLEISSTHKLRKFSQSIYDDVVEVKLFRKSLLEDRAKLRMIHLANNESSLNPTKPGSAAELGCSSQSKLTTKIDPLSSAKNKLTKYSLSFDPLIPENQCVIIGFHGPRLSRQTFGHLIRQCMHVMLTIKEVDSLYDTMDTSEDGTFDGREFTRKFFNLGNAARRDKQIGSSRGYQPSANLRITNSESENIRYCPRISETF